MNPKLDFAAFVGIDWADREHAVCVLPADGGTPCLDTLEQRPEAIALWADQLRERFGGRPVAVCLEQSRGPLFYALATHDFLHVFPINPAQSAAFRKALRPSGAKDDPGDAEILARFLRDHADRLREWRPDDEITQALRLLTPQRRDWVEQRVGLENELRQRLKETYPLALQLFPGDLHAEAFLDFLARFPAERELRRASPRQLAKWLPRRRRTGDPSADEFLEKQIQTVRQSVPLTQDRAVLEHARLVILNLIEQIRLFNRAVAQCDEQIARRFAEHPDREIFVSFPGAGVAMAPRLAAAFGTDREKIPNAPTIQNASGVAPITLASGKTKIVRMRRACPRFLRQTFHEFARCSVKFSPWAHAYLAMRRAAGTPYQAAIRGLAYKWQRILFHCWKHRQPYNELHYLQRLQATNAKLLQFLTPPTPKQPPTPEHP